MTAPKPRRRPPGDCHDFRCLCGSLLARLTEVGVEIKCRRCKRTVVVPLAGDVTGRAPPS
jgi:hypothetical protein